MTDDKAHERAEVREAEPVTAEPRAVGEAAAESPAEIPPAEPEAAIAAVEQSAGDEPEAAESPPAPEVLRTAAKPAVGSPAVHETTVAEQPADDPAAVTTDLFADDLLGELLETLLRLRRPRLPRGSCARASPGP